jgi:tetratricopeptide (TPR) repeat protein
MICLILTSCATGLTPEQLAAQAETRRQAQIAQEEAAKKQAAEEAAAKAAAKAVLEAKIAKVHADEQAGDAAAQAGNQQAALTSYMTAFNEAPQPDIKDEVVDKIARFAGTLSALPEVPEVAVRYSVRATAKFKEKDYDSAVSEMQQAVQLAPWWADGYYNLGLMQEGAKQYGDAMASLKLFLQAAPKSSEANAVQNKIYELEVAKEDADKTKKLEGDWVSETEGKYKVEIQGGKIEIIRKAFSDRKIVRPTGNELTVYEILEVQNVEENRFHGIKKGLAIEGTVSIGARNIKTVKKIYGLLGTREEVLDSFQFPPEEVPFSGVVAKEGNRIKLKYIGSTYEHKSGIGVSVTGKREEEVTISR